ncbi:Oxygen-regulated protein 1 [Merluccius polli]|uniref:Oxygen-regulated protein 1 n=1 Tax=Merluccius polli TaxID=89951 RepID=A0AA47NX00_MERPO|nr:Oxygen-regulated protein 1 [Merluccius polli]
MQETLQMAEKEELEETPDVDSNSIMSVEEERGRGEVGQEDIEDEKVEEDVNDDEMERWKEEETYTTDVGQKVNKGILEVKNVEQEWCQQSIDEKEHDEGQNETGELTEGKAGEATEDSAGEMGFTDKDQEVDEEVNEVEDEKQDVVDEKETSVADEMEEGCTIQEELSGEEDKISEQFIEGEEENTGESTEERGDGDVEEQETGEESGEESDEESCRKDDEEGREVDVEAEQEVEGEQSSDEEKDDDVEEHALNLSVRVEEMELNDEEDEETGKPMIADAVSAINTSALVQDWYSQPQSSCKEVRYNGDDEKANANTEDATDEVGSVNTCLNESQCEDEKDNGTDAAHDLRTDDGEDEEDDEKRSQIPHPVEISQELIDFVNSALQSSSLIFTYDTRGNVRIEPDNAKVIHTKQMKIPKSKEDSLYGLKRLPSPSTSDLSDYRPETSESGGYNTLESIDIVTESGGECENMSPEYGDPTRGSEMSNRTAELTNSNPSLESKSEQRFKTEGTFSYTESGTKASKEDLSYFSAASSLKADPEVATDAAELNSNDGVLIDKGRWLLKENHLIRKSPPALMGMYDDVDSSMDTAPDNTSEDSHPHSLTDQNPLAAISSSELEEMAKPHSPKCRYYNMAHGSDSDPFLDDGSVKSSKQESSNGKGKGFKVSPTIDTSKTWLKKNGSLSSFASVEFKMPDSRVHPEGNTTAVAQARRPPSGAGHALRAQDSVDALHVRCGQYCPIL